MKYFYILIIFFIGCKPPTNEKSTVDRFAQIKDSKARELIKRSINDAGGLKKWETIKELTYTKKFDLLLESGEVEKAFKQKHDYQFHPTKIHISSTENTNLVETFLDGDVFSRTKNGAPQEVKQESLRKAINTSTYVVSMPFKLLDKDAVINYEGEKTLEDGRLVDVISVNYDAEKYANHSTSDHWKYYFDKENARIVANWVASGDHSNIVENLTFERVEGILFNKHRKSYRLDSLGNKTYLRAEYFYDNYVIK